jgi:hypothetical protein
MKFKSRPNVSIAARVLVPVRFYACLGKTRRGESVSAAAAYLESISIMNGHANSIGLQGLKPLFSGPLNVAAEAATHKDYL